jgi:hypothetical protein
LRERGREVERGIKKEGEGIEKKECLIYSE